MPSPFDNEQIDPQLALQQVQEERARKAQRTAEEVEIDNTAQIGDAVAAADEESFATPNPPQGEQGQADVFDPNSPKGSQGTIPDLKTLEVMNEVKRQNTAKAVQTKVGKIEAHSEALDSVASKLVDKQLKAEVGNLFNTKDPLVRRELDSLLTAQIADNPLDRFTATQISLGMSGEADSPSKRAVRHAMRDYQGRVRTFTKLSLNKIKEINMIKESELRQENARLDMIRKMQDIAGDPAERQMRKDVFLSGQRSKQATGIGRINVQLAEPSITMREAHRLITVREGSLTDSAFESKFLGLRKKSPEDYGDLKAVNSRNRSRYNELSTGFTTTEAGKKDVSVFKSTDAMNKNIGKLAASYKSEGASRSDAVDFIAQDINDGSEAAAQYINTRISSVYGSSESENDRVQALFSTSDQDYKDQWRVISNEFEPALDKPEMMLGNLFVGASREEKLLQFANKSEEGIFTTVSSAISNDLGELEKESFHTALKDKNSDEYRLVDTASKMLFAYAKTETNKEALKLVQAESKAIRDIKSDKGIDVDHRNLVGVIGTEGVAKVLYIPSAQTRVEGTASKDGEDLTREDYFSKLYNQAKIAGLTWKFEEMMGVSGDNANLLGVGQFDKSNLRARDNFNTLLSVGNFRGPDPRVMNGLSDEGKKSMVDAYFDTDGDTRYAIDHLADQKTRKKVLKLYKGKDIVSLHNTARYEHGGADVGLFFTNIDSKALNGVVFGKDFVKYSKDMTVDKYIETVTGKTVQALSDKYRDFVENNTELKEQIKFLDRDDIKDSDRKAAIATLDSFLDVIKKHNPAGEEIARVISNASPELDENIYALWQTGEKDAMTAAYLLAERKAIRKITAKMYNVSTFNMKDSSGKVVIDPETGRPREFKDASGDIAKVIRMDKFGELPNGNRIPKMLKDAGFTAGKIPEAYRELNSLYDTSPKDAMLKSRALRDINDQVRRAMIDLVFKGDVNDSHAFVGIHANAGRLAKMGTGLTLSDDSKENNRILDDYKSAIMNLVAIETSLSGLEATRGHHRADSNKISNKIKTRTRKIELSSLQDRANKIKKTYGLLFDKEKSIITVSKEAEAAFSDAEKKEVLDFQRDLKRYNPHIDPINFIERASNVDAFFGYEKNAFNFGDVYKLEEDPFLLPPG